MQYPELLKNLVSQVLRIDPAVIREFTITNPEITPEYLSEKFCRLDVNMIVDGQRVDLEAQVKNEGDYRDRSVFYLAREHTSALGAGEEYSALPRTVGIRASWAFGCSIVRRTTRNSA